MHSDHRRVGGGSTPLSSSPGRSSSFPRPHWPWSTYTSTHRSSQSSVHSSVSTPQTSWEPRLSSSSSNSPGVISGSIPWQPIPPARHNTGSTTMAYPIQTQESTRQWSFTGFEWVIRDVQKLKEFLEGQEITEVEESIEGAARTPQLSDFEILKESPVIGDNKFKLEIACTQSNDSEIVQKPQTLGLFITSLLVDCGQGDYEMSASMMTSIKCQDDRAGERGARPEWVWEYWQTDWVFRQESEVWECPLPPISVLLENERIRQTDSFVICIQIHCPVGPFFPQHPSAYYVPKDLLDGLEASLDNANTGDVRFICLERLNPDSQASPRLTTSESAPTPNSSSSSSSRSPFPSQTTARKRVIYAHSDILTRRSEYFATMFASSFSENPSSVIPGDRKLYTVVVEEADFETTYWLLKFCYANWLLFKEEDDPRAAVRGIGAGWSARWLNVRGGEWDWKTFRKVSNSEDDNIGDAMSITSGESMRSNGEGSQTSGKSKSYQAVIPPSAPTVRPSPTLRTPSKSGNPAASSRQSNPVVPRRSVVGSSTAVPINIPGPSVPRTKSVPVPLSIPTAGYPSTRYSASPRSQRQHHAPVIPVPDPHPHPTPAPSPASALSIYQVAHRYDIPGLATLALEHIMNTITPQASFALLLATSVWDELRSLIEDYIVERWDEVSLTQEFELCCEEVAAGEWGSDGGKTMMALFRRLRSPSTMVYPRV